ncbi:TPA: hypothetical protein ACF39K_002242 [Vibrio parahaemolyticus]|uniref:hypothetical protein n=1 Tax=Vibrio parahaemolyticus TaxID=670 RepID=UPI001A9093FD|nr:hypothetical protein [Vibrio parahaemolyticus]MBE4474936.1 hypothetical protein [Vibrio parahaemolyticus]MBO0155600.1 hypothetical protein [Vibrio parahaemolyticus]MBO0170819.1 hypothetical protein [Vibrio parahaemolyticus]MEA5283485.1 hypothetical protein [Vibrio parahaemolyticus]HCE1574321.1 hypothetical protein [Vibrio parahaemolyticus]
MITIELNTLEEALHIQNVAALNISKYQQNPVEGQECQQNSSIRLWQDIRRQAGLEMKAISEKGERA